MAFTPGVAAARTGVAARWLMAGAAVVLATAINFGVQHATGGRVPFLPYFPALVFVGVYSGAVPALLSLGASALLGWYFWFPPLNHFGPPRAEDSIALLLFVIAGGVVISISVRARELIDHLRASREALRQAQAAVHESEQRLRLALEGAQLGMWTTDLESGVTHASDIDAALFGFEARARILTHEQWLALVHPDDRELVLGAWQAARERNLPYSVEYRIVRPDGRVRWIYSCGRVELADEDRTPRRTGGISMDITERKEAERARAHMASALRRAEEEFARIVNLAPVGLIVARDPSCTAILSNPYAERLFGVEPGVNISLTAPTGPLKGRSFRRGGEHIELDDLPLRIAARTGQSVRNDLLQFVTPGGATLEIIVSAEPLLDESGKPRGAIATLQDVTAMRSMESALHSSEQRFRVAQDTSLVAFAIFDAVRDPRGAVDDFIWSYANEAAARVIKQPLASILGRRLRETLPGIETRSGPFELLARVMESGEPRTTRFDYHADNISGTFEAAITKLGAGSVAISFMDVTERQSLIGELRNTEANLREADRQKDEFLATLAHELRNPMAPIRYAAAIIRPDAPASTLEQAREMIERQAGQMSRLLDDLLDMSRITRNVIELKREVVDLRHVVEEAVQNARLGAQAEHHVITLTLPPGPAMVSGDVVRLGQVVGNLLQNATKYTPAGGHIDVSMSANGNEASVTVHDTGVGLSPEMLEKAFKLFSQLHPTMSVAKGGLGIGLAISKRLAELHGGTIEARSDGLGHGSVFTLHLPLESRSDQQAMSDGSDDKVVTLFRAEPRVLVVDDNRDAADSLTLLLRSYGLNVHVAYGGRDAVVLAETVRPDLLLLDIGLPDISGLEVAREVRRHAWARHARIIAVTGWGQEADKARTREAGFDAHLVKPVDPEELLAYLRQSRAAGGGNARAEH